MVNELEILHKLRDVIVNNLNNYITYPEEISSKNVLIEFPDVDLMVKRTMIYLQSNYGEYENLSTESDESSYHVSLFILCKKDNIQSLTEKAFDIYNGLYKLFRTNMTLDNYVDFVDIESFDFYPAIEGNKNVVGIEMLLNIRYCREY